MGHFGPKFWENILSKMVKKMSAVAPKTDFFWIVFSKLI